MPSPYDAEAFEWDDANESELARHRIGPSEVEQVFSSDPLFVRNKRNAAGDRKMIGRTAGGRVLTIVVRWQQESRSLRPITGWDCTEGERNRYLK